MVTLHDHGIFLVNGVPTAAAAVSEQEGRQRTMAWNILQADEPGHLNASVVSNAAYKAPKGTLSTMFQAGGLIELSGDIDTAFDIYYEEYDIHELPPLNK